MGQLSQGVVMPMHRPGVTLRSNRLSHICNRSGRRLPIATTYNPLTVRPLSANLEAQHVLSSWHVGHLKQSGASQES